ncbi:tripartite tricarboxylate transporter substrate binding protein [Alloalcanivorax xenomutans]|uniref:Tripartite tricarboxylate transporter substrate binding protein n=2 Tax=Alloalcanivorax xenomutans TaxID=1094342 RepID=A0A9Q3W5P3_9GAMM|nr:tripartite tricarboxylate transporter substrate binding protein [Alloalcanivorax xenomutans]MBA4720921.1 tripartite tricarboxylate transporter substrate binding protein [Alcanivorax sp.]MCE7508792.1 tripartite tricarboxylate transporter substrate binding protein [Alloalcanivorax xenomutans]MCE7524348.1 tripartite tricarboxylate transporter substrate binding protein [Alloalcanivorax xenomutans]WOD28827.1 tripartite tricarboxylate transporter substrate binding protein [Alloalcanivorax xenomuta
MKITKLLSLALTAALPSLLVSPLALAEDFPTRPITEIVPYPAGGSSDLAGRALANALADHLGVNVVVDNRSGGGGSVGISALARARTDGYTIGVAPIGTIANQPHMHRTPYNTESFDYLCQFYYGPEVLVVKPDSPFNTLNEVIDYAKAHPGKLSFGSPGPGTLPHLDMLRFQQVAGIELTHVPFAGDGPGLTALMGGHVDLYMAMPNTVTDRNLDAVAVFSDEPMASLPGIKTVMEQGHNMTASVSGGLVAPKGLPQDIKQKLVKGCEQATESEELKKVLARVGFEARYQGPDEFRQLVEHTSEVNGRLINDVIKKGGGR